MSSFIKGVLGKIQSTAHSLKAEIFTVGPYSLQEVKKLGEGVFFFFICSDFPQ